MKQFRPGTFVDKYMKYMNGLETPASYDFWSAMWLLSLALGRGVQVARPRIPVHMNWYVLIVAESGLTRKSTAVTTATKLARKFIGEDGDPAIFDDKTTPEQFEYEISRRSKEFGHAHISIGVSELVRFLGRERYKMALPGLLTDMYDCPEFRTGPGTIRSGQVTFREVYVNFLSASTASWLVAAINPDVIEGGFTSRVVVIHSERPKKRVAWPDQYDAKEGEQELVHILRGIRERGRTVQQINLTPNALKHFKKWYNSRTQKHDPFNASWQAREDEHVLRLAACLAINDEGWLIEQLHISRAINIIAEVREDGSSLFEGTLRKDSVTLGIEKLREIFMNYGKDPIAQTELYLRMRTHMDASTLKLTLETMHELNMVQRFQAQQEGPGRRKTLWRGTELLIARGALDELLIKLGVIEE